MWLSKHLCKLTAEQSLPGVALVGAIALMLDGVALRWFSSLYGFDEMLLRIAAAWLLWGYGVAFLVAIVWSARVRRR